MARQQSVETAMPLEADAAAVEKTWRQIFEDIDADRSGKVDFDEISLALQKHQSGLILQESQTFQQKMDAKEELEFSDFKKVMEELRFAAAVRFFDSVELSTLFAKAAMELTHGQSAQDAFKPLASMASLDKSSRLQFGHDLIARLSDQIANDIAESLDAEQLYNHEQGQDLNQPDKFTDMVLGPPAVYDKGLDQLLGAPDQDVLEAMRLEHLDDEDSLQPFEAYNGKLRTSTPAEEWHKALPKGVEGCINTKTYDGLDVSPELKELGCLMDHPKATEAKCKKYELLALRLYSGPMFVKYNGKLREMIKMLDERLAQERREAGTHGAGLSPEREDELFEDALVQVRSQLGRAYVNTIHAINSGLIKLARVTPLPPSGCGYRGLSGLNIPPCFLRADRFGCRGGVEGGFLSTSTDKGEAMRYVEHERGMPQLFVMRFGQINRGADVSWLSYFPSEREVLLPPLSCLEVVGTSRYDRTPKGLVKVTPLGINVNLKGRTIEELQAMRKELHGQMAENALKEVTVFLEEKRKGGAGAQGLRSGGGWHGRRGSQGGGGGGGGGEAGAQGLAVDSLVEHLQAQCEAMVHVHRGQEASFYNDDAQYSTAIGQVLEMKSVADGMLAMLADGVGLSTLKDLRLEDLTHEEEEDEGEEKGKVEAGEGAGEGGGGGGGGGGLTRASSFRASHRKTQTEGSTKAYTKVCKKMRLFKEHINEMDSQGNLLTHQVVLSGQDTKLKLLLKLGASLQPHSLSHKTPAWMACEQRHHKCLDIIAQDSKCDLSMADKEAGKTPALVACEQRAAPCLRILADHSADLSSPSASPRRRTPACVASELGEEECVRLLAEAKADLCSADAQGRTPAYLASMGGHTGCLRTLMEHGAALTAEGEGRGEGSERMHPAVIACEKNHAGCLELLVKRGAVVRQEAMRCALHGKTPALAACQHHSTDCLRVLAEAGADLDAGDPASGTTPAIVACELNNPLALRILADANADLSAGDTEGRTPAWIACKGASAECLKILVEARADLNTPSIPSLLQGISAAHMACRQLACDCLQILADAGARLDLRDALGKTPANMACVMLNAPCLQVLADAHADLDTPDKDGKSPGLVACENESPECLAILSRANADLSTPDHEGRTPAYVACEKTSVECLRLLAHARAHLDHPDSLGRTAAFIACRKFSPACLALLIEASADLNAPACDKRSPAFVAAENGSEACLELLVGRADLGRADERGRSPALIACFKNSVRCLRLLADAHGVDLNAPDDEGRTPAYVACENKSHRCLEILAEAKADLVSPNKEGKTPAWIASEKNAAKCSKILALANADTRGGVGAAANDSLLSSLFPHLRLQYHV